MKKNLFLLLLATAIYSTTMLGQIPGYVPTTGLSGWWSFSGNANDASVAGNNLSNTGGVLTTDRHSNSNSAYQFNGTNQYMILNSPSFSFGQTSTFTVSFWMQRTILGYGVAIMHGAIPNGSFIWNFQTGSNGEIQFGTNKQGSAWNWAQSTYQASKWEHIVGTYNNGLMTLYKDGVSVGTATNSHVGALQATLPFYVGRGVAGAYFNGKIDDIGVWNRVLNQAEITALFTGCGEVTLQPSDTTIWAGGTAQFAVASSDTAASYQWQADKGSGYTNLANGGQYSGVTTGNLSVSMVNSGANGGQMFRCLITSGGCMDTTTAALLTVFNIGIDEWSKNNAVSVYPNPAGNILNLRVDATYSNRTYSISNNIGQNIIAGELRGVELTVDISTYEVGYYVVKIGDLRKAFIIAR